MKKYEYKNLHTRPIIAMGSAQEFSDWVLKQLNIWGSEGWLALQVTTPTTKERFTGDLFVLAVRELPASGLVEQLQDNHGTGAAGAP